MTGEEAQKIAESTIATPPDVLARAERIDRRKIAPARQKE